MREVIRHALWMAPLVIWSTLVPLAIGFEEGRAYAVGAWSAVCWITSQELTDRRVHQEIGRLWNGWHWDDWIGGVIGGWAWAALSVWLWRML